MIVELERFKIKKGKEEVAKKWIRFLNENIEEVLKTLIDEKMFIESIFSEYINDELYFYWLSFQGIPLIKLEESLHEVDHIHLAYWKECIDTRYQSKLLKLELNLLQDHIAKSIEMEEIK